MNDDLDYSLYIPQLERLRELMDQYRAVMYQSTPESKKLYEELCEQYGAVSAVVEAILGRSEVNVEIRGGVFVTYPNLIEAGFLSGRTFHTHEGYSELLKVIGKAKMLGRMKPPHRDIEEGHSIEDLVRILNRFRECCQYINVPLASEAAVQDIVWIMLRSQFDLVDREDTLPKFGAKNYRPDFGIRELRALIEVKYIGEKTSVSAIQEEIIADVPGYLSTSSPYESIVVLVYDASHKLLDPKRFVEDLCGIKGIASVLVIPGIRT
jgi:hypothetical protein